MKKLEAGQRIPGMYAQTDGQGRKQCFQWSMAVDASCITNALLFSEHDYNTGC